MSIFSRLKRLWELSGEQVYVPSPIENIPLNIPMTVEEAVAYVTEKPKGRATVVQDDPLDIFPNEEIEDDKTS